MTEPPATPPASEPPPGGDPSKGAATAWWSRRSKWVKGLIIVWAVFAVVVIYAAIAATPQQRVREALGDEVSAPGYAGDVEIREVGFDGVDVRVTATTPEGGFQGASCGDLDDGARAIFETVYNDGGWKGRATVVFAGGLVDSSTGQEMPTAVTGTFTMPAVQAKEIDWSDEDALANIDWSLYRDFCHRALE